MKTLNSKLANDIFEEFALSVDEMIQVRGGTLDPTPVPTIPPIKI
jgi:hypothetical protein